MLLLFTVVGSVGAWRAHDSKKWPTADGIVFAIQTRHYLAAPFALLFSFGYAWVSTLVIRERMSTAVAPARRPRLVTPVTSDTVSDADLKRMHEQGARGIRFNLAQAGATTPEMLEPLSKRVNALGWHVQIHMLGDQIVKIEDLLDKLPSPIVFDHLGRIPQPAGTDHPAFGVIRKLIDKGRTWVKLSGAYQDTKVGPPSYADTSKLAQAYAKAAPERMVWASDWPHPTQKENEKANDAVLFDLLTEWAPDDATRQRILVANPATLYDFPK